MFLIKTRERDFWFLFLLSKLEKRILNFSFSSRLHFLASRQWLFCRLCDLVYVQSVVDLFAKQLNNALNVQEICNVYFLPSKISLSFKSESMLWIVIIGDQKSMINLIQFEATIWARHNTLWKWRKILKILTLVWVMEMWKCGRKMLAMSLSHINATNVTMQLPK